MSLILLGILNSQAAGAGGGSYELIESNILTSSASSVTFSSIPADYKHLQIRAVARTDTVASEQRYRLNGATSGYSDHRLFGNGSGVYSGYNLSTFINGPTIANPTQHFANSYTAFVTDILDYANTSKNTTLRSIYGVASNTNDIRLSSGLYQNTAAINQILIYLSSGNYVSGSRFSLYGIRG